MSNVSFHNRSCLQVLHDVLSFPEVGPPSLLQYLPGGQKVNAAQVKQVVSEKNSNQLAELFDRQLIPVDRASSDLLNNFASPIKRNLCESLLTDILAAILLQNPHVVEVASQSANAVPSLQPQKPYQGILALTSRTKEGECLVTQVRLSVLAQVLLSRRNGWPTSCWLGITSFELLLRALLNITGK